MSSVFFKGKFPTPSRPFQSLTHRWILNNNELNKAETGRPDPHFWTLLKCFGQRHQPTALAADKQWKKETRRIRQSVVLDMGRSSCVFVKPSFDFTFFWGGRGWRFSFCLLFCIIYIFFPIWRAAAYVSNEFKPCFFHYWFYFWGGGSTLFVLHWLDDVLHLSTVKGNFGDKPVLHSNVEFWGMQDGITSEPQSFWEVSTNLNQVVGRPWCSDTISVDTHLQIGIHLPRRSLTVRPWKVTFPIGKYSSKHLFSGANC